MLDFSNTKFLYSATDRKIKHDKFQIAMMGRSNVGKSSLINDLCQNKHLSKTSSKPGKTQLINFFEVTTKAYLVDLPGYGFAKIPKKVRQDFSGMIENYLLENSSFVLVVVLLDIRHLPTEEDRQLIEWLNFHDVSYQIVFTKCDKMPGTKLKAQAEKNLASFPLISNPFYLLYSTKDKKSRKNLTQILKKKMEDGVS